MVGKAMMVLVKFPGSSLRSWLISPIFGFSLQILIVSIINQAGYPVEQFGRWEAIITSVISIGILAWKKPSFNLRLLAPFIGASFIVLAFAGWPLFKLGLSWLSYCNDDMANYCLAAKRSLYHGFFQVPTLEELTGGDYSQCYWFMYVRNFVRYGCELLLASVAAVSGSNPLFIFMPTIVALGMTIPLGVAALVRASHSKYKAMVLASWLVSLNPLFLLGIFYQLIAQVAGVALLCATAALLMQERFPWKGKLLLQQALILGTLGGALCITYPEITPFLGLGFLLWMAIKSIQKKGIFWKPMLLGLCGGVIALFWVRYNLFVYIVTLYNQIQHGTSTTLESDSLFPYFLVPSGLPALFGFFALADPFTKIEGYCYMAIATFFLLLWIFTVIDSLRKGKAAGCIAAVMIGMGALLFYKQVGFGLFKLAMFMQPFIAIELALFFCSLRLLPSLIGLLIYCGLQLPVGIFYGTSSLGLPNSRFVEIPGISGSDLLIKKIFPEKVLSLKSSHLVIEKFLACLINQPCQILNINRYFENLVPSGELQKLPLNNFIIQIHPYAQDIFSEKQLLSQYHSLFNQQQLLGTSVIQLKKEKYADAKIIRPLNDVEPFNGLLSLVNHQGESSFFQPALTVLNKAYLTYIFSEQGQHYYGSFNRKKISFYQKEKDSYSPNQSMAGIGRYFLFEVTSPSPKLYLRVAVTKSILGNGRTHLFENALVKGKYDLPINFKGNGAANLFIGPLSPLVINGASYLALDFGEEGQVSEKDTRGIMGLYGKKTPVDPRYLIGYARDISAITGEKYATMERPRSIKDFPKDLAEAKTLEFSGWYEDGWISQHSYVVLGPRKQGEDLVIKGIIPGTEKFISEGQTITVSVNGISVCDQQKLKTGPFELTFSMPKDDKKRNSTRIDIEFSGVEKLAVPDDRPVSAKISYLGLQAIN
jgi:hypothetical protein